MTDTLTPTTKDGVMNEIKNQTYRARTKARAIEIKGGKCEVCDFDDARALRFHHIKPVRRRRNGLRKQSKSSTESHRAVVRGDGKGLRLLCCNCSTIAGAKDWAANANIKRATTRGATR